MIYHDISYELLAILQTIVEMSMLVLFGSVVLSMSKALEMFNNTLNEKGRVEMKDVVLSKNTTFILENANTIMRITILLAVILLVISILN